jgi:hypothetical protein
VTDLDVDLDGLSLDHPEDVDLLLVGPGGQQATLMSDAGGTGAVSGVDLTLDDEAGAPLDAAAPLTSGRFRPTNLGGDPDAFPEPAPASSGKATLSTFDGTDPNGTWSLYVVDDGDPARPGVDPAGALSGWSLDIETDDTPPTGTVRINAGAATTSSTTVSLDVSADDPGSASTGVTQVRFSNDGKTYSEFRPYFSPAAWTLTDGDGVKTVYAQFRDASGNVSVPVSDTITLRSVAPPSTPTPTPTATPTPAPAPLPAPVDRRGPRATMFVPVRKADGVSRMTRVDIQASEALAPASVNHRTVFLRVKGTRENVRCTVAYRGLDHVIVIEPSEGLTHHTTYLVKVKAGVTDLAGNGWDQVVGKAGNQPLTTQFTTA